MSSEYLLHTPLQSKPWQCAEIGKMNVQTELCLHIYRSKKKVNQTKLSSDSGYIILCAMFNLFVLILLAL